MLKQTSSTEKAEVQATVAAEKENVGSSLNHDLSFPHSLRIRTVTLHLLHFTNG